MDALLAQYACGALPLPLHMLLASHLVMRPENARFVAQLESLHSREMDVIDSAHVATSDRDVRLNAIFARQLAPRTPREMTVLPAPLVDYIGCDLDSVKWRTKLPGLKEFHIETRDGLEASLLWIRAGRKMLSHTHDGSETTLVLKGSFSDVNGRYESGDVAIADPEIDHAPRAGAEEDCICFAVTDAPVRLTGPIAKVLTRLLGH